MSLIQRMRSEVNKGFASVGLSSLSKPAKIVSTLIVLVGTVLAWTLLVLDSLSDDPSSTAVLIFPFMALYMAIAVAVVAGVEWSIRLIARRWP